MELISAQAILGKRSRCPKRDAMEGRFYANFEQIRRLKRMPGDPPKLSWQTVICCERDDT